MYKRLFLLFCVLYALNAKAEQIPLQALKGRDSDVR